MRNRSIAFILFISFSLPLIWLLPASTSGDLERRGMPAGSGAPATGTGDGRQVSADAGQPDFVPGEFLVKLKPAGVTGGAGSLPADRQLQSLNEQHGILSMEKVIHGRPGDGTPDSLSRAPGIHDIYKVKVPAGSDIEAIVSEYANSGLVEHAEPNYLYRTATVPNDPEYHLQWAHQKMLSEQAWDLETGNPQITIAIIDTGVDWNHPDLAGNIWSNEDEIPGNGLDDDGNGYADDVIGYDFVSSPASCDPADDCGIPDNDPMDFHGHGTHVSGIAAGMTNNMIGVAGMCWDCRIMPLRAGYKGIGGTGYLEDDDVIAAIVYAADNNASIISMSFGSYEASNLTEEALAYAYSKGVVLVAAAGNDNTFSEHYPAAYDDVIAVGATDEDDSLASFSNYGNWIDVSAPGENIMSTMFDDAYESKSGTSMSAPYAAGIAALVLSEHPGFGPDDMRNVLSISADDVGLPNGGRVNAYEALQVEYIPMINASITSPADGSQVSGLTEIRGTASADNFSGYRVEYALPQGIVHDINWTVFGQGSTPVHNGPLATLNTSALPDGYFLVRLLVTESVYNYTQSSFIGLFRWDNRFAKTNGSIISSVNLADLDNDGDLEIVVKSKSGYLYAWDSQGNMLPGWPVFIEDGTGYFTKSQALEDSNPDAKMEEDVLIEKRMVPGAGTDFMIIIRIVDYQSSPAIGDIDGDGYQEVAVGGTGIGAGIHVFRHDGTAMPGWPNAGGEIRSSPTLADLDNDGKMEIIACRVKSIKEGVNYSFTGGDLYVYRYDGTLLPGWPVPVGVPSWSMPSVGDLDGDGDLEIAMGGVERNYTNWGGNITYTERSYVHAFHADGTPLAGWPKEFDDAENTPWVLLGDVDDDGSLDVVARINIGMSANNTRLDDWSDIYAWKADGTVMPGWPKRVGYMTYNIVSLGDLDDDGDLEILLPAQHYPNPSAIMLFAFHHDGTNVSGWPVELWNTVYNVPAVFDVDGDGSAEVVLGVWDGYSAFGTYTDYSHLYAWHGNGSQLDLARLYGGGGVSTVAAADADNDGRVDVFIGAYDGYVYRFREGAFNQSGMKWPMLWHDQFHTGRHSPSSPLCFQDTDCGDDGWLGHDYCDGPQDDDVWDYWREWTCNLPGTEHSYCSSNDIPAMKQDCAYGCDNGACMAGTALVHVNPPSMKIYSPSQCNVDFDGVTYNFSAGVGIETPEDIYAGELELHFDPAVLHALDAVEGGFLSQDGAGTFPIANIDNAAGMISFASSRYGVKTGVTGSGSLAGVTFRHVGCGLTALDLQNAVLVGPSDPPQPVPALMADGTIDVIVCRGDVTRDGSVNIFDLAAIGIAYGRSCGDPGYNPDADLNCDCKIDIFDLAIAGMNWGSVC